MAITWAKEWQQAQSLAISGIAIRRPPFKPLLSPSLIICCTDSAWKSDAEAGLGWIFKDAEDRIYTQGSMFLPHVSSPLMAEALATLIAMKVAIESTITQFSFASDSPSLVKALNSKIRPKELHEILQDILNLSSNFTCCSFNFIPRDNNRHVDALAKVALVSSCTR